MPRLYPRGRAQPRRSVCRLGEWAGGMAAVQRGTKPTAGVSGLWQVGGYRLDSGAAPGDRDRALIRCAQGGGVGGGAAQPGAGGGGPGGRGGGPEGGRKGGRGRGPPGGPRAWGEGQQTPPRGRPG